MTRKESLYPRDWFRIGGRELKRAENLLGLGDLEGAGFNVQQGVEKYLKGYLLSKGWQLRRTHNLVTLLNDAIGYDRSFDAYVDACQKITQYYVEERYPLVVASRLTDEEVKESLKTAAVIVEKVSRLVGAISNGAAGNG